MNQKFQLNFLNTTADEQKRTRVRRYTTLAYLALVVFTASIGYNMYSTQSYVSGIVVEHNQKVSEKISEIEPVVLFLEQQIQQRNKELKHAETYLQSGSRPSVWQSRLAVISDVVPTDILLSRIEYSSLDKKAGDPHLILDGQLVIRDNEEDIYAVDNLREELEKHPVFSHQFSTVQIENNHVYKEKDDLKLLFTLGYYP